MNGRMGLTRHLAVLPVLCPVQVCRTTADLGLELAFDHNYYLRLQQ